MKALWNTIVSTVKRFGHWLWPVIAAVLLVLVVRKKRRAERREQSLNKRIEESYIEDLEERDRAIEKDIRRADRAQERARKAGAKAKRYRDDVADADPELDTLLDEYRSHKRLRHSADAT